MRLVDILHTDVISANLRSRDRWEAIAELMDLLVAAHDVRLSDRRTLLGLVHDRERSLSTGLGDGVAIPHGTSDDVEDFLGAFGVSETGIDFDAADGQPVYLVLMLIIPRDKFSRHIRTLSSVARLLHREPFRSALRSAGSAQSIMDCIRSEEEREFRVDVSSLP